MIILIPKALTPKSKHYNAPNENTQVLPVPLYDCTITSLPLIIGNIALFWTAEGLSNPYAKTPLKSSSLRSNSSKLYIISNFSDDSIIISVSSSGPPFGFYL